MTNYTVKTDEAGKRLDVFVIEHIPELSRAYVKQLIETGKVLIDKQAAKAGDKVKAGQRISVTYNLDQLKQIPDLDLPILYEDENVIVINKPVGVLTHSKGRFNPEGTVATFIAPHIIDMEGERAGIVHRLDRSTSGVIIAAKQPKALAWLQKQFASRKTKKTYQAIIEGQLDPAEAIIDMPIERNPKKPQTFRVGVNGKPATTLYKTLKSKGNYSLVELQPTTGRTHQLRVHMSFLGHPIVGDTFYGGQPADRLFLHALKLEITLPNFKKQSFKAPLPIAFKQFLKQHG